jgi:membrane fusion protein (multidrug efflux system)
LVPGTVSVFALLPPDNAAGNFIHIVERVPVRIALRKDEILKNPIRPGLSTTTSIYIKESEQPLGVSHAAVSTQEYETDIFVDELVDAEAKAQEIIRGNLIQKNDPVESNCMPPEPIPVKNTGTYR